MSASRAWRSVFTSEKSSNVDKPNILSVVGERVELRKAGKEFVARCPFHADKTPSFSVNEDKGVFHCFGCGESGDVFDFVMKLDSVSFAQAAKSLGVECTASAPRPRNIARRRAAALLAGWMNEQHLEVGAMLRELSQQIAIAQQIPDSELVESLNREWEILSDIHADLQRPECAAELLEAKDSIEAITAMAPVEPLQKFPPLTPEYQRNLAVHLPKSEASC